ncbi:hypothetical protein niasHS_006209 [Heterodera schachtii]|uniref:Uncharacterized protein n=1 Tax=Heterodera schachtii TaxID=97005 RepID=A0ABD2JSG9_HETSC
MSAFFVVALPVLLAVFNGSTKFGGQGGEALNSLFPLGGPIIPHHFKTEEDKWREDSTSSSPTIICRHRLQRTLATTISTSKRGQSSTMVNSAVFEELSPLGPNSSSV